MYYRLNPTKRPYVLAHVALEVRRVQVCESISAVIPGHLRITSSVKQELDVKSDVGARGVKIDVTAELERAGREDGV